MTEVYRAVSSIIVRRMPLNTQIKTSTVRDLRNYNRLPNETLYLLVQKPRQTHAWQFPQGGQDPGETGLEAALRELREECGSQIKVDVVNRNPLGSYKYKFPSNFNRWDTSVGANVKLCEEYSIFIQIQNI
ncbi:hypothetical protein BDF20DRAFT_916467 [Mycotypha africana]|uniref:uncharacterized protein n=1 Tax=Mycotypha africana TaxID=64632 RepID=UPI002300C1B4|nr:uncharacterized protein BDF20DRAFT_916467 [Mycotypha africana]KAI8969064.1 hypothetical protein BDF20DRAFT_916467 [Mycotypha africana]